MAAEEPVPVTPDVAPLRSAGGQCEPPTLPRLVPLLPKREALLRTFEALRVAQAKGSPPAHTLMALRLDRAESPTEEETPTPSVRRSLLARTESTSSSSADGDRKRSHSASEGEEADDDALSTPRGPCEGSPRQRKRPKTKWRKPTYLVRKEEKDVLLGQIRELEAQVQFLHRNVGAVDWQLHDRRLVEKEVHNNLMRESMRNQQLQLLTAQSALSELTHAVQCPIETFIRLGRDWSARRATLVAMKPQKLHDAVHLLDRRTQFLDDTMRECSESSQFLTDRGDLCVVRFDVVPLDGVHSIKDVFDASCGFLQRVQTDLSEEENTNVIHRCSGRDGDETILHRRVLMSSDHMATESNFVVFSELTQPRDQHQHQQEHPHQHHQHQAHASGLLVFDFVDEDELYPYRSQDYLRQDVSGAVRLSMRSRRRRNEQGCLEDEPLVVLTRWVFITVHRGGFPIPTAAMQEVKQRIHRVGDEMIDSIRDSCASPKPSAPPTPVTPSMRPLPRLPSIRVPHYSPPPSMTEQL